MKNPTIDAIREVIGDTWFDIQDQGLHIDLSTRDNGDVGDEKPGDEDISEGKRIHRALRKKWPLSSRISIDSEQVDEWSYVTISKEPMTDSDWLSVLNGVVRKYFCRDVSEELNQKCNNFGVTPLWEQSSKDGYKQSAPVGVTATTRRSPLGYGGVIELRIRTDYGCITRVSYDRPQLMFSKRKDAASAQNKAVRAARRLLKSELGEEGYKRHVKEQRKNAVAADHKGYAQGSYVVIGSWGSLSMEFILSTDALVSIGNKIIANMESKEVPV